MGRRSGKREGKHGKGSSYVQKRGGNTTSQLRMGRRSGNREGNQGVPGRKERCSGRALATNVWERVSMMSIFPGVTPIYRVSGREWYYGCDKA